MKRSIVVALTFASVFAGASLAEAQPKPEALPNLQPSDAPQAPTPPPAAVPAPVKEAPAATPPPSDHGLAPLPSPTPAPASRSLPNSEKRAEPPVVVAPALTHFQREQPEEAPSKPKRYVQRFLGVDVGFRSVAVKSAGFDPYGESDFLPSFALAARFVPLHKGGLSLGFVGEYDYGTQAAAARGDDASLVVHRMSLGVEGRATLWRRLAFFTKVAPAALAVRGTIMDASSTPPLVSRSWTWGLDTTGGVALLVGRVGDAEWPALTFWLGAEIGYSFSGQVAMTYSADADSGDPRRYGTVEMPALKLAGVVDRLALTAMF